MIAAQSLRRLAVRGVRPRPSLPLKRRSSNELETESSPAEEKEEELRVRVKELRLEMTDEEISEAVSMMPSDSEGRVTNIMYQRWLREKTTPAVERIALLSTIQEVYDQTMISLVLRKVDQAGVALYAALGCLAAGDAGMHVVGCTLVGCVSGLGGGTLNAMMSGATPVYWMAYPTWLGLCLVSCFATFYGAPVLEDAMSGREVAAMEPDPDTGLVHFEGFKKWLEAEGEYQERLKLRCLRLQRQKLLRDQHEDQLQHSAPRPARVGSTQCTAEEVFASLQEPLAIGTVGVGSPSSLAAGGVNSSNSGGASSYLDVGLKQQSLRRSLRLAKLDSPVLYLIESLCLCTFSVSGAQAAIIRGLPPLACAACGITSSFGGIVRDLLTKKEWLTIGHESFAFTTGAGAAVYVGLRQLMLHGPEKLGAPWLEPALRPVTVRIGFCVSTVLTIRAYAWTLRPEPLLYPMFAVRPPPSNESWWSSWTTPHTLGGRLSNNDEKNFGGNRSETSEGDSVVEFKR